jgi:prohibitin 1
LEHYSLIKLTENTMKVTNKSTVRVGAAGVAVIGIIVLFLVMFAVERIDSGQTGIIVNLAGSERGVDDAKVETGWVVYNRFAKQLFEYPAFAQIVDYEPFDIQDKKGTIFKTDPTIEYFIERGGCQSSFSTLSQDYRRIGTECYPDRSEERL